MCVTCCAARASGAGSDVQLRDGRTKKSLGDAKHLTRINVGSRPVDASPGNTGGRRAALQTGSDDQERRLFRNDQLEAVLERDRADRRASMLDLIRAPCPRLRLLAEMVKTWVEPLGVASCVPGHVSCLSGRGVRLSAPLRLHDLVADCVSHQGGSRGHVEFSHDSCAMAFHRLETNIQDVSNLLVGVPFGNELNYPSLSRG
jgi:hypothetical protein